MRAASLIFLIAAFLGTGCFDWGIRQQRNGEGDAEVDASADASREADLGDGDTNEEAYDTETSADGDARRDSEAETECRPSCAGRECGEDACGGECPPGCSDDERCDEASGLCGPIPVCELLFWLTGDFIPLCVADCELEECSEEVDAWHWTPRPRPLCRSECDNCALYSSGLQRCICWPSSCGLPECEEAATAYYRCLADCWQAWCAP